MRRGQDRPIMIEPVMQRYLVQPTDFTNNARLLQFESLINEIVDFEARQILNFSIVSQVLEQCRRSQERILEIDLERRSSCQSIARMDSESHIRYSTHKSGQQDDLPQNV